MEYDFEQYYYSLEEEVPFQRVVSVTAAAIGRWCTHFEAIRSSPTPNDNLPRERTGLLPVDVNQREDFVRELCSWIFANSRIENHFYLELCTGADDDSKRVCKFLYADDGGLWWLKLSEDEFADLQGVWEANGLPRDLFFPYDEVRYASYSGNSLIEVLLRSIGLRKRYTPRQWAAEFDEAEGSS